jgi:hypothetical protein
VVSNAHVGFVSRWIAGVGALGLVACVQTQSESTRPDQAVVAACRQRADAVFLKQNRDLLSRQDRIDSPLSSTGYDTLQTTSLAGRYERDNMVDDCIRGEQAGTASGAAGATSTGSATGRVPGLAPGVPVPAAAPAAASSSPVAGPVNANDLAAPPPP